MRFHGEGFFVGVTLHPDMCGKKFAECAEKRGREELSVNYSSRNCVECGLT